MGAETIPSNGDTGAIPNDDGANNDAGTSGGDTNAPE
jgi:hypothetical protein